MRRVVLAISVVPKGLGLRPPSRTDRIPTLSINPREAAYKRSHLCTSEERRQPVRRVPPQVGGRSAADPARKLTSLSMAATSEFRDPTTLSSRSWIVGNQRISAPAEIG